MGAATGLTFAAGWLPAFASTWLIETIVYLTVFTSLGWLARSRRPVRWTLLLALGVNLATHPLLWLFTSNVAGGGALVLAELLAVAVEGSIIAGVIGDRRRRCGWIWAYLAALLANAVSLLVGLMWFVGTD